jgi:hypothetical protein
MAAEASTPSTAMPHAARGSATGPSRSQFQHGPVAGQSGQELHRMRRIEAAMTFVIDVRPAVTVKRGIIEVGHTRHPTAAQAATATRQRPPMGRLTPQEPVTWSA